MKAVVKVRLKNGVLDPQGKAVLNASHALRFDFVKDIRVGKLFEIECEETNREEVKAKLEELAKQLLANTVIENFEVEIL